MVSGRVASSSARTVQRLKYPQTIIPDAAVPAQMFKIFKHQAKDKQPGKQRDDLMHAPPLTSASRRMRPHLYSFVIHC